LSGVIPVGAYLVFHLATNAAIIDGVQTYQRRADQIHRLGPTTIFVVEWLFIFLPILFHGVIGMVIVARGKRNIASYPYGGNIRYTLQRATGVIAFAFILWHVFQMHGWIPGNWWVQHVTIPLGGHRFDPEHAFTAAEAIQSSWIVVAVYAIGVLAAVYHLANGLWTAGITWGVWTGPDSQSWAKIPCTAIGILLAVLAIGSLYGMVAAKPPAKSDVGIRNSEKVIAKSFPNSEFRLPVLTGGSAALEREERPDQW
jgi:succinate dehydrogenase / fumarate reductase cytochrome b subunit